MILLEEPDKRLQRSLDRIESAVEECEGNYEVEVNDNEDYGFVSVTIRSDDFILNKGEIGDETYHIILGPRGGLRTARRDRIFGGTRRFVEETDTKRRAWGRLLRSIRRAK